MDYYLEIVKHLIICNGLWDVWAEETFWEWDYFPSQQENDFFWEMCYLYHIINRDD